MGLLSAVGAAIGTAVLPGVGTQIGAGLGAAADGAITGGKSKKAATAATQAQLAAIGQNRQLATDQYGRTQTALNPYIQQGQAAQGIYNAGLGIPTAASGASGSGFDPQAYGAANPDLAQYYQEHGLQNDPRFPTLDAFLTSHYQTDGQREGRPLGTEQAAPQAAAPMLGADGVNPVSANNYGPQGIGDRPNIAAPTVADRPNMMRPNVDPRAAMSRPSVGARPDAGSFSYGLGDYTESPAFQFQLTRGLDSVASSRALGGSLKSGAATKSALEFATQLAYDDFANERNFAYNQYTGDRAFNNQNYNTDTGRTDANYNFDANRSDQNYNYDTSRTDTNYVSDRNFTNNAFENDRNYNQNGYQFDANRSDQNFNSDRSYSTGQFNSYYDRLGGVANQGYGATGQLVGAGANFAASLAGLNSQGADATGNNLLYQANIGNQTNQAIGNGVGYAASFLPQIGGQQQASANPPANYMAQLQPNAMVPPMQRYTIPYQ